MVLVGMMVLMVFITVVFYKSSVCCDIGGDDGGVSDTLAMQIIFARSF